MANTRAQRKTKNNVPPEVELEDDGHENGLDSRTTNLCNLVFGIDLLRETIIDFVIHDHNDREEFSKQNALSCRLVQKTWLESVFRCLVKSGKTLVKVGLQGRPIELLLQIYDPSSPLPFQLATGFVTGTVERSLEKCLRTCNNGLVELKLQRWNSQCDFGVYRRHLKVLKQPKFTLPNLQKLNYCVEPSSILPDTDCENNGIDIHSVPQSILSGASNLKYFYFGFIRYTIQNGMPLPLTPAAVSLGNLILPKTIKKLELNCKLGFYHLEPLLKINMLSNLTDLTVVIPDVNYGDSEWFSRVLNQVRHTLKNLTIDGDAYLGRLAVATIDPPVMKCLKRIFIRTVNFEWADGITDLHQKLPALEKLDLRSLRSCSLKKWMDNSKFDLLTDLRIQFYDIERATEMNVLTIDNAQLMCKAFLKVTKLHISTPCLDETTKPLQCLFQNMTQLQVLTLELCKIEGHFVHSRYLDALLVGISYDMTELENFQLKKDEQLSIVNLSQLVELTVDSKDGLFVSDSTKALVVSRMPNLQKIKLPLSDTFSARRTRRSSF